MVRCRSTRRHRYAPPGADEFGLDGSLSSASSHRCGHWSMSTRFSRPPGTVIRIHGNRSSFTPVIVDTTDHTRSAWEARRDSKSRWVMHIEISGLRRLVSGLGSRSLVSRRGRGARCTYRLVRPPARPQFQRRHLRVQRRRRTDAAGSTHAPSGSPRRHGCPSRSSLIHRPVRRPVRCRRRRGTSKGCRACATSSTVRPTR